MTTQLDLLADTPRARNSDPTTSHKAAARIKATGALGRQQGLVLAYIRQWPGCTTTELARHMAEAVDDDGDLWPKYRLLCARRCPELAPVHARKGDARECRVSGRDAHTWYPR